jgi:DMSO/TMAO reductase YedYZ molybdopterin-dependent catalytic subunit
MGERRDLRLAGLLGAAVALATMFVASSVLPDAPFPPSALAERAIRSVPGEVATFFIEALGSWARKLTAAGAVLVALALGAEVLARTGGKAPFAHRGTRFSGPRVGEGQFAPRAGVAGAVLSVGAGAASFASPAQDASLVPVSVSVMVAFAAYVVTVRLVWRSLDAAGTEADAGRRRILRTAGGAALGIAAGGWVVGLLARSLGGPNTDVDLVEPAMKARIPERGDWPDIPGLSPEVTSAADHYVVDINLVQPSVEADGWALKVFGEVENPAEYDFLSLQRSFDVVEEYSVLCCVSNEVGGDLIGNSAWSGVRLREVLEAAGPTRDGLDVVLRAADGYSDSIPLEVATRPDTLLALAQNGAPLTQEHGFPCRVRIPSIYGMKNVKWLESIELTVRDYQGYWQERGWSDIARVRTQSRIDVAGEELSARLGEPTWIAGIAWAGDRGISKVEVSTDGGGSWSGARLKEPISGAAWTLWAYRWTPEARGTVVIECRAADGEGGVQTEAEQPPHPAGATGYHRLSVRVT